MSLAIWVNPERARANQQLPKAGPSVIMGRQPPKTELRLVRGDQMAIPLISVLNLDGRYNSVPCCSSIGQSNESPRK